MKPVIETEKKKTESVIREEVDISGVKLLLVEDNELNAEIVTELLEDEGAKVIHAENGQKALEIFMSSGEDDIDLILMDIQMPVMNGLEATRRIRESGHMRARSISIIAMTANAFDEDIRKCRDAGMNAHAYKPVNLFEIKNMISGFMRGRE